jgi:arginine N-succinyltransferase
MFLIRSVLMKDLDELFELSKLSNFISLPQNKEALSGIIQSSLNSFQSPHPNLASNNYVFVLENIQNQKLVGVSLIHAQHGTTEVPHFFLKVTQEHKYSHTIHSGFVHGLLTLGYETDGPTEIGGLVIHPQFRGHPDKLGKQLSYSRFFYMGLHPDRFKETVHSELLPPFDEDGNSPLWEAIGRRFMNMDYQDADQLSRRNKEFILALFPSNSIYVTLLPTLAQEAIGQVNQQTLPVKKMLEQVGFKYINEVDPFDGGPHYRCKLKEIIPIKTMASGTLYQIPESKLSESKFHSILLRVTNSPNSFAAINLKVKIDHSNQNDIKIFCENNDVEKFNSNFIHLDKQNSFLKLEYQKQKFDFIYL